MDITLSTKDGYPNYYIVSEMINVEGYSAFISIDFSQSMNPRITLVVIMVSAHKETRYPSFKLGDKVTIGMTEYEIQGPDRFLSNSNIKLVPVG